MATTRFSTVISIGAEVGSSFRSSVSTVTSETRRLGAAMRANSQGQSAIKDFTGAQVGVDAARAALQAEQKKLLELRKKGGTFKTAEDYAAIFAQTDAVEKSKVAFTKKTAALDKQREALKKAGIDTSKLSSEIERLALESKAAAVQIESLAQKERRLAAISAATTKLGSSFSRLKSDALATVAAVSAIGYSGWKVVSGFGDMGDEAQETALALGMTAKELQGLRYAGERVGVTSEKLDQALNSMNQKLADAQDGSEKASTAFNNLGLDADMLAMQTPAQRIDTLANAFRSIPDATKRAAYAAELFGAKNFKVANILAMGTKGLREMRKEGEKTGFIFTDKQYKQANDWDNAFGRFRASLIGIRNDVGSSLMPTVVRFMDYASDHTWILKTAITGVAVVAGLVAVASFGKLGIALYDTAKAMKAVAVAAGIMNAAELAGVKGAAVEAGKTVVASKGIGKGILNSLGPSTVALIGISSHAEADVEKFKNNGLLKTVFQPLKNLLDKATWQMPVAQQSFGGVGFTATAPKQPATDQTKKMDALIAKVAAPSRPTVNNTNSYTLNVNAAPGQSADEIADAALRKLQEEQEKNDRSSMWDTAPSHN